jgi:hypothetical protein
MSTKWRVADCYGEICRRTTVSRFVCCLVCSQRGVAGSGQIAYGENWTVFYLRYRLKS